MVYWKIIWWFGIFWGVVESEICITTFEEIQWRATGSIFHLLLTALSLGIAIWILYFYSRFAAILHGKIYITLAKRCFCSYHGTNLTAYIPCAPCIWIVPPWGVEMSFGSTSNVGTSSQVEWTVGSPFRSRLRFSIVLYINPWLSASTMSSGMLAMSEDFDASPADR